MTEKLKPCPFCGNRNVEIRQYKADGATLMRDRYAVLCHWGRGGCGAEGGWYHSPEEATVMWNRRRRKWKDDGA